tara:strand:+ start:310 stop:576 length:267 start_codon:yes stop_codon:yes gene_type:complete
MKKTINKNKLIEKVKIHANDVGSSQVQISILTERIKYLTTHFSKNKKDKHSNTGLNKLIIKRKKLLDYLNRTKPDAYQKLIKQLDLRK